MGLSQIRRHSGAVWEREEEEDKPEENLANNNAHFITPTTHYQSLLIYEG